MNLLLSFIVSFALLLATASASFAVGNTMQNDASNFTSCLTPTGTVIANYSDGTHGIPGQGVKIGKDIVYQLDNGHVMQCFCGSNGEGIQTNWLKTNDLSEDEVKVLQAQGWIYIPTGAAWGLADESYLARNIEYSCKSSSSSSQGSDTTSGGGNSESIIQPAVGNLATTGNMLFIAEIFGIGILLTVVGLILHFRSK